MNGLDIRINLEGALYASEQKTVSYLAIMAGPELLTSFLAKYRAPHISPLNAAQLTINKEIEMKKVFVFAVALMFPAFVMAEPDVKGELNDAEIAHVVVTANQVDIENGELAKKKASNKDVHAFARRMINEHTDVNKQVKDLTAKLNMTPEDNTVSKNLKADGKKGLDKLKNLSSTKFDKAYIDAEIKLQQKVIDVADTKLVPNVKNEELKALLVKVRTALAAHLERAQTIKDSVGDKH